MKTLLSWAVSQFVITGAAFAQTDEATPADEYVEVEPSGGASMPMGFYFPDDFDPDREYPVMISVGTFFLHDDPAEFGWVVVRAGVEERQYSVEQSAEALDYIASPVNVASDSFHIFGYSASSAGVFRIAAALPDRFRGVLAMPGHPRQRSEYEPLSDMQIRFIVGENEGYWLRESEAAHRRFERMGTDAEIEIIENGGHVLSQLSGRPLFQRIEAEFGEGSRAHH
ncbi:hypothetical protein [Maricaulis sp. MIT060901]|uniref:hypothetical protein n=1 Tax=Maricaulis sp. MIT060901 TaxID=3096993 RepID=UPI00399A6499